MVDNARWLEGPMFLQKEETLWPTKHSSSSSGSSAVPLDDPEVRKEFQAHHTVDRHEEQELLDVMINRYSSWYRLRKGIAWLLKFKEYLTNKRTRIETGKSWSSSLKVTLEEVQAAERKLIDTCSVKRLVKLRRSFSTRVQVNPCESRDRSVRFTSLVHGWMKRSY
jgi:hypothetical protein